MIVKINQKVIGRFEDNVFRKTVEESKHLFRTLDAYGIDAEVLTKLLLPTNATIEVYDKENQVRYISSAKHWKDNGQHYHFKGREDYRAQVFLPKNKFEKTIL